MWILIVICILIVIIWTRRLPGPWYGCRAVTTWHEIRGTRTQWIHSLHQKYGPVVRLSSSEVSFNSVDALHPIYGISSDVLKDPLYGVYAYRVDNMFSTLDAAQHAKLRRGVAHIYSKSYLYRHVTSESVMTFIDLVKDQEVNVYELLSWYTLDNISSLVFGEGTRTLHGENRHLIDMDNSINWERSFKRGGYHLLATLARWVAPKKDDAMAEYISTMTDGPLISRLSGRDYIISEARDHVIAGSDTTTNVLAFLLHELSLNERVWRKLQEIDFEPSLEELDQPYLDAVIKEALRLWAAIPMTLPRIASRDMTICGVSIPKGTTIGVQCYSLHRNPVAFPSPDEFLPERWMNPNKLMTSHFWAFSSGSRSCIGQNFAMLEMKWLIAGLTRFNLTRLDYDPNDMLMSESITSFTMTPRRKFMKMRFTTR